jgi:hypothetical protein
MMDKFKHRRGSKNRIKGWEGLSVGDIYRYDAALDSSYDQMQPNEHPCVLSVLTVFWNPKSAQASWRILYTRERGGGSYSIYVLRGR